MKTGFIYMWFDRDRKMYYIGSRIGSPEDSYVTSSHWLAGEIKYRPSSFRRRILAKDIPLDKLRKLEYSLICKIKPEWFGTRYYNVRGGRKKGTPASNKGKPMSIEQRKKLSDIKRGIAPYNKGKSGLPSSRGAENGKKSAHKVSQTIKGRKLQTMEDGSRRWVYPAP